MSTVLKEEKKAVRECYPNTLLLDSNSSFTLGSFVTFEASKV